MASPGQTLSLVSAPLPGLKGLVAQGVGGPRAKGGPYPFPAPFALTTFNPGAKNSHVILSNGNLTTSQDGSESSWCPARGTVSRTTGKFYFEAVPSGTGTTSMIGISRDTQSLGNGSYIGSTDGIAYWFGGATYCNGQPNIVLGNAPANGLIGVAIDLDAQLFWWLNNGNRAAGWNNDVSADPARGQGGSDFSVLGPKGAVYFPGSSPATGSSYGSNAVTANFGATQFAGVQPAGFCAWNGY